LPVWPSGEVGLTSRSRGGGGGFKFEASWLKEDGCRKVVEDAWGLRPENESSLRESLRGVATSLKEWSMNVLGDLEKRVRKAKKELGKWRKQPISDESVQKEAVWSFKVDRLEEQIDIYWRQRAHVNWLQYGDRNTTYFHNACSARRRNRISDLEKEDGGWVVEEEEKKEFIANHFSQLFKSGAENDEGRLQQLLDAVQPGVTVHFSWLNSRRMKLKRALDAIGDLKAPGPDGMPSIFFKEYWDVVGGQLTKEVMAVLRGGRMHEGWNDTIISLIPKVQHTKKVTDLRPITLCNVVYKVISKVLANRLREVLPDLIMPNQSAFVPRRLISNNILMAYELTHYLVNKMSDPSPQDCAHRIDKEDPVYTQGRKKL